MMIAYKIPAGGNPDAALAGLLARLLEESRARAVLVPALSGYSALPMPSLVSDPGQMAQARPLAPAMPINAARVASRIARHQAGKLILVLRPCECRALVELAKLKQCDLADTLVISQECPGRLENANFLEDTSARENITRSCSCCRDFLPEAADIRICLIGLEATDHLALLPQTPRGRELLEGLGLESVDIPDRAGAAAAILAERQANHDRLLEEIRQTAGDLRKLEKFFANCINCQNCRVNCPVCYCRDCVFNTDVFDHQPEDYLRRAAAKGRIKLPADTTMFHLTRMAHMAHACVGCGLCSSACPSGIPVADLFRAVADKVQRAYGYKPGLADEPIPYQVWEDGQGKGRHA